MAGKLNARRVETLTKPGRYADGNNLYLFISANGGKRWTFFYRLGKTAEGKEVRREMGLGGAARGQVSLAEARERALESAGAEASEALSQAISEIRAALRQGA